MPVRVRFLLVGIALCLALPATAQTTDVGLTPATLVPNYSRLPVGQEEALEGGAYVARAWGATANWYNPAGLVRTKTSVINASVSGYEFSSVNLSGFDETGRTRRVAPVPGFFGFVLGEQTLKKEGLAVGLSVTRQISWDSACAAQLQTARVNGTESVIYDSNVAFATVIPQAGIGYRINDHWRIGAGLGVAITDFGRSVTLSDDLSGPAVNDTQLNTSRLNGVVAHLMPSVGVQFDINDQWTSGLTVRSIGIRIAGSGNGQINSQSFVNGEVTSVSFLDTKAKMNYRPPLQVAGGVAYRSKRFALEVDFAFYDTLGDYDLFKSDQQIFISRTPPGQPRVDASVPFPTLTIQTKPVFNGSVGGRFNITKALELHAGFFTDFSPVSSSNFGAFQKINLYGGTFGASLSNDKVAGTIGLIYVHGQTDPFNLDNNLAGGTTETHMTVNTISLLYALSYQF